MTQGIPAVVEAANITEEAPPLDHRSHSGTVAPTGRRSSPVESFASVSAAALSLGHRTYSGTVASTARLP
jgi:hypothetical protein